MNRKRRNQADIYESMRDAIFYLRTNAVAMPDVKIVAKAVGMSPSRFEHAFRQWAGLSPGRFLSYLTKERAKQAIKESKSILKAAHRVGLSGPSRLHDLLVVQDAVSPGEFKSGEIEIWYGVHPSPFGLCLMGLTKRGICHLSFFEAEGQIKAIEALKSAWPKAKFLRDDKRIKAYHDRVFALKNAAGKPLPLVLKGTNFQIKVWEALLRIPEGKAASYASIAKSIGHPKAVRAVGSACGKNPIGFLIPCHRVLTSEGGLGGYASGTARKDAMLTWEALRADS